MKIVQIFETIPDFRNPSYISHLLSDVLIISFCAILSGADDFEEIAEYGKEKEPFLSSFLKLPKGVPSHDTIRRVFQNIEPSAFEQCLRTYAEPLLEQIEDLQINIDGKVLRATGKRGKK